MFWLQSVGDLFEPGDAARAVRGCDAVLCAVGSSPGVGFLLEGLVDDKGVRNLIDAAVAAGVETFVYVNSVGVGDSRDRMPWPYRLAIWPVLRAMNRAEAHPGPRGCRTPSSGPGC